ncbi:MAG: hypothetical protein R2861_03640 [Desulfobacterales bacterium]
MHSCLGMLLLVNRSYKLLLSDALKGDKHAQNLLGIDKELLAQLLSDSGKARDLLSDKHENSSLFPSPLTLFLTNTCTMSCRYCYAGEASTKEMTAEIAEKLLRLQLKTPVNRKENKIIFFVLNIHGRDVGLAGPFYPRTNIKQLS